MQGKKILVCPLNWGLGHATRLIPVIESLIENKCEVILGGSGNSLFLLKNRFPNLKTLEIPSAEITYSKGKNHFLKMLFSLPKFLNSIRKEKKILKKIVMEISPDLIISDNRYGLYHKEVESIIITHQLFPALPKLFEGLAHRYIASKINRFKYCFIPDNTGIIKLTGKLADENKLPENARFIGLLSRFHNCEKPESIDKEFDILVILSGPEPHRTILEKKVVEQIKNSYLKAVILRAKPQDQASENYENIIIYNHVNDKEFLNLVNKSRYIIARSGYSTIMDLIALQRNALLIPTPGQTEQEYLAKNLHQLNYFVFVNQDEIDLPSNLKSLEKLSEISDDFHFFKNFNKIIS